MDLTHCKEIRLSAPPGWTFAPPPAQKPRPPILIGGNGRLLLALAAREADIVGFSGLTFRKAGAAPPDLSGWRLSGVDERVQLVREAAGDAQYARLELNALVQRVVVTNDLRQAAEELTSRWTQLTTDEILQSPYVLIGTVDQMVEDLHAYRDRWCIVGRLQARGQIDGIADHRVVARLLRTDIAHDHIAGGDADADIDLGKAAPETGYLGELGAESGKAGELIECGQTSGPQKAMIPSPIYLSMIPLLRRTGSDITVMYRFSTLTSAAGVIPSLSAVNPFISQNKIVISRREPLASVSSGRSSSPATMRGSTYLPNVSRICALIRSSPTMLLKDCVSRPISSREVIGTTVSSAPPSTAAVPASRRRTGRTRPRVTAAATVMPSNVAIANSAKPIWTTCR